MLISKAWNLDAEDETGLGRIWDAYNVIPEINIAAAPSQDATWSNMIFVIAREKNDSAGAFDKLTYKGV